jgi:hypothetical protein
VLRSLGPWPFQTKDAHLDVVFVAYQRLQQIRQGGGGGGGGQGSVMEQIKLEKCKSDSMYYGLLARKYQVCTPVFAPPAGWQAGRLVNPIVATGGLLLLVVHPVPDSQMDFWKELAKKTPSLSSLDAIGTMYEQSVQRAESSYELMLRLSPNNAELLRSYAQYLLEVRR